MIMSKIKTVLAIFLFIVLALSCDWIFRPGPCDASGPIVVYKTKQDYSNNITIQLSKDKKKVTCTPGPQDAGYQRPAQLADGYLLKRMCGDAVTSITYDDYIESTISYTSEEWLSFVIDTDPYLEKYECCKCTGQDTAVINDLIRNKQLSKCDDLK
jgi:hypothetical protein